MTISLTFTLPKESSECRAAQDGAQYKSAFIDIMRQLRSKQKYGNIESLPLEQIQQMIMAELNSRGLNLE